MRFGNPSSSITVKLLRMCAATQPSYQEDNLLSNIQKCIIPCALLAVIMQGNILLNIIFSCPAFKVVIVICCKKAEGKQ